MTKPIYLDHGATTPVDKQVLKKMLPYFDSCFGNAASVHSFGQAANEAVQEARTSLAKFLNSQEDEIVFTSGATESNNLATKGMVKRYHFMAKDNKTVKPHVITTAFEHHCVLDSCKALQEENLAKVTFLQPDADGIVSVDKIIQAIKPNTLLVSIMYVNNEIGTVQPIEEIGKAIAKINRQRENRLYFHTDATQAVNYFDCDVEKLGVDMLSLSGHKIYGPKGIGALYVRQGTPMVRIQDGGDQENRKRAGTLNVAAIVGLGQAIELVAKDRKKNIEKLTKLRDRLIKKVLKEIPLSHLNGSWKKRSPNNANFSFDNVEGESLLLLLDMEGIAGSTGSACNSQSLAPSHVLLSIGLKPEQAHGSLRLTLGKSTTLKDIDFTVKKIKSVVEKLRSVSGQVLRDYYKEKNNK